MSREKNDMKRNVLIAIILPVAAALLLVSCNTKLPVENSSVSELSGDTSGSAEPVSEEASSSPETSEETTAESSEDQVSSSEEPSVPEEDSSAEESFEASDEPVSEEPSAGPVEESSEPEESSEEPSSGTEQTVGNLAKPYLDSISSGRYRIRISETRTVGGEALPYTVTAFHKGGSVYYEIEESYGSKVTYLRKGGKLITLDAFSRVAMVADDDGEVFEKTLWTGDITLTGAGTEQLFDTDYRYEKYVDSKGFEFTLFFNILDELERYRSYDSSVKDTIVISLSVSDDISDGIFDIPSDYTVMEE